MSTPAQGRTGRFRIAVTFVGLLGVLGLVNLSIVDKEKILRDGTVVLLELAPRDPRSLLQGDYMALDYAMARPLLEAADFAQADDGYAIIELDGTGIAKFVGRYEGAALEPGQHLLRYRRRGGAVRIATDAFFFEEGQGPAYSAARYGELRVSDDGDAVLTGLRDATGQRLGPQ